MAKILHKPLLSNANLYSYYMGEMSPTRTGERRAVYTEEENHGLDKIILEGRNLSFDLEGEPVSGRITQVSFTSAEGKPYMIIKDLNIKASQLPDFSEYGFKTDLIEFLRRDNDVVMGTDHDDVLFGGAGKDVMIGKGGRDTFYGDAGNDRMTGGSGADYWLYHEGNGNDVITDFNPAGGPLKGDRIDTGTAFELRKAGQDVIVDFVDGSGTIRLLDVRLRDVSDDIIYV